MFFIMGISQGEKQLDYTRTVVCGECGKYGRYEIFMTYMYFSFFFIPLFKWDKHYYVRMSCCGSMYELNPEVGARIACGEDIEIAQSDMFKVSSGQSSYYEQYRQSNAYQDDIRNAGQGAYGESRTQGRRGDYAGQGIHDNEAAVRDRRGDYDTRYAVSTDKADSSADAAAAGTAAITGLLADGRPRKICPDCGYESPQDFEYCPKCGRKLET